jgi:hypothetical protein
MKSIRTSDVSAIICFQIVLIITPVIILFLTAFPLIAKIIFTPEIQRHYSMVCLGVLNVVSDPFLVNGLYFDCQELKMFMQLLLVQ